MKSQTDLQYVQFQPSQDLLDVRFQVMSPAERGVYWTIKLYLYANGGKCPLDEAMLRKVTGCENFGEVWEKIKTNFVIKNDMIRHKIVSKNLRKAKKCLQNRRRAGLIGAQKRWQSPGDSNGESVAKKRKDKKRKDKIKKEKKESSRSNFQKPTAGEVTEYAESIGFKLDGRQFVDFYEAKGWMVGKNKMRDWRAAVRTWKGRSGKEGKYENCQRPTSGKSGKRDYTHKPAGGEGVEILTD